MQGNYNLTVVALSYLVAVLASHVTLDIAGRVRDSSGRAQWVWLGGGAFAMGAGIWLMHFIGMLAFELPIAMSYDMPLTALSLLIAAGVAGFALYIVRRGGAGWRQLILPGTLIGLGISTMHYIGMAAMRMTPAIRYDNTLFAISVLVAIAASVAALWIALNLHRVRPAQLVAARLGAALLMGAGIAGMHYTGMAAAHFEAGSICGSGGPAFDVASMVLVLGALSILLLLTTLAVAANDARLGSAQARRAEQLQVANVDLDRRVEERALHLSHEEVRKAAILNAAPDCIITADSDGLITEFNPAAERCFGYRRDEALGRPLGELISPSEYGATHAGSPWRSLAKPRSLALGKRVEGPAHRKDGTVFLAELSISAVAVGDDIFFTVYLRDITERKQAEEALRAAGEALEQQVAEMRRVDTHRERYLALSKLSADWFWDQDAEFRFIDLDSSTEQYAGIGRNHHIGKRRWELPHTEPVSTTWALHRAELAAHKPFRNLLLRRTPPTGVRYVNVSGEPVFAAEGRFAGYRGVASDVTERVEAELALAATRSALAERTAQLEHAALLQTLLEALPVGVSLTDQQLNVIASNGACRKLLDLPEEMLQPGTSLETVFRYNAERGVYGPGEPQALVAAQISRVTKPQPLRYERVQPDGRVIEFGSVPLPAGGLLTTFIDITERKRAEMLLRDSERKTRERASFLQALLDALPVGVALIDKDLNVLVANEASVRLQGLPAALLKPGSPMANMFRYHAEAGVYGPGEVPKLVAERLARARDPRPLRTERELPDGSTLEIRGVQMPDGTRVTTFTDITERKTAEFKLRTAKDAAEAGSQAKSAFLAVMSHEIRTPMNAVIGLLELLRLSPLDAEQQETVDTVRESSKSLLRLIDDVLDFSKIEAGKLELHQEASSLAQVFDSAHQNFSGIASQKGVLLEQHFDPRIAPAVVVDRLRLRQIINNLLSNAIKFTEEGRVVLRAELLGRDDKVDRVRISVQDTGVGIDAAVLTRLFEPFSQADVAIERRYGGTGLGLAICKRLAELMGTTIELQSSPGVGTRIGMTLLLPRAGEQALQGAGPLAIEAIARAVQGRSTPTVEAARAERRLILVVDDHPTNRRMLARQLNTLGYAVQTAADGRDALAQWQAGGFGLIITDCQMPVMDGYQLAAAVRTQEAGGRARVPIVACTANVSKEALEQCLSVGMDQALTKPIELATLKQMLDHWLPAAGAPEAEEPPAPLDTDFAAIEDLAPGDLAIQRDLLDEFRKANAEDLKAAARAVHSVSIDEVRRAAHRIKGAARMVGAARLANAATRLEQAAQAGDWQRVSSSWPPLQQESLRLDERIAVDGRQRGIP